MKNNSHRSSHHPLYPVKTPDQEPSTKLIQYQSPYLRAILSGKGLYTGNGAVIKMVNSDRDAAGRYIRESKWRNGWRG